MFSPLPLTFCAAEPITHSQAQADLGDWSVLVCPPQHRPSTIYLTIYLPYTSTCGHLTIYLNLYWSVPTSTYTYHDHGQWSWYVSTSTSTYSYHRHDADGCDEVDDCSMFMRQNFCQVIWWLDLYWAFYNCGQKSSTANIFMNYMFPSNPGGATRLQDQKLHVRLEFRDRTCRPPWLLSARTLPRLAETSSWKWFCFNLFLSWI